MNLQPSIELQLIFCLHHFRQHHPKTFATSLEPFATSSSHESTSRNIRASVTCPFRASLKAMHSNRPHPAHNITRTRSNTTCIRDSRCTRRVWRRSSAVREATPPQKATTSIRCQISSINPCRRRTVPSRRATKRKNAKSSSQSSKTWRMRMRRCRLSTIG